jgi:hypothetical protein
LAILLLVGSFFLGQYVSKQVVKDDTKEEETNIKNDKTNITEENIKEEEVSSDKYKYLLDRLYGKNCGGPDLNIYLNLDKLTNSSKIQLAINSLSKEKVEVKNSDEFELYDDAPYDNKWVKENLDEYVSNGGYKASSVEKRVKEIFGKNTSVKHQAISEYENQLTSGFPMLYDKTAQVYIGLDGGCGGAGSSFQNIIKTTIKGDKLYIYVIAGYEGMIDSNVCYDYNAYDNEDKCISTLEIAKKYNQNVDDLDESDINNYIEENNDKFAQYKYTFTKEDDNYIITSLEKIK